MASRETVGKRTPVALLRQAEAAYRSKDWAALRALHHDEARLFTMAAGERVVGPDELVKSLAGLAGTVFAVGETRAHALDDDAVLISGRLRWRAPDGGIADARRSAIMTFKDGLVWRSHVYRSHAEARAAYRRYGIDLGL